MAVTAFARYDFHTTEEDVFLKALNSILQEESCVVQKHAKGKVREMDIRPLIYRAEGTSLLLAHASTGTLSPGLLLGEIERRAGKAIPAHIVRRELYLADGMTPRPLYTLFCE